MKDEIKAEFKNNGFTLEDEDEILDKCVTFCINYKLKPSDLVVSWEVYCLNRQLEYTVQNGEMDGFFLHLQNEQKEALIKEESHLHLYSSKDVDRILGDEHNDIDEEVPSTPPDAYQKRYSESYNTPQTEGNIFSSGKPSKHVTPFGHRTNKFVEKYSISNMPKPDNGKKDEDHEIEDDIISRNQLPRRCSLQLNGSGPEPGCRFMYDRIEDRFNTLENRIKKHANALIASGRYGELMDPTVASQDSVYAVGMICCDGEGHLNDKSILLQSSVEHSGGQRVRLELQKLSHFSIFPGQVVGIEGNNPSGHCLIGSRMVDSIPFSTSNNENMHPAKRQALDQEIQLSDEPHDDKLSLIIAAGPFTTSDNLLFEPLTELLTYASRKMPQLLVLMGPFVDSEHPDIKKATVDKSFDEIFHQEVLKRLRDYVEFIGSTPQVVLVPSIRDANHDYVFPQPAFDIQVPHPRGQITSLTNPGIFQADQFRIGCCTVDVIKQLSGEELSRIPRDGPTGDRMTRLVNHILSQHSFYPLYPPAENVPLDSSLAPEALDIPSLPDILILPSDVKYFVKVLSVGGSEGEEQGRCICVNPGRLAKGEGGGTFLELHYSGSPDKMNASVIAI